MTARSSVHGAESRRARLNRLAWLLDSSIRVPGTDFRVGLDALLGLLPGGGDVAGVLLSSYIVLEAARMGAPGRTLFLMVLNVAVEALVGAIPLVGDLFDAAWKANQRNVSLLNAWLGVPGARPAPGWLPIAIVLAALLGLVVLTVALVVAVTCWALSAL
jgi:Domain of unknown function (DUF4112)